MEMTNEEKKSFKACMNYLLGHGGYSDEICFFEHGGRAEVGSSSIDHCHVHVIDGKYGLYNKERYNGFIEYEDIPIIKEPYLMVGKYNREGIMIKVSTEKKLFQRQYFRRRLAEILGEAQWDWRKDYLFERMIETMKGFQT